MDNPYANITGHIPVLPELILTLMPPQPGQIMLDCTLGRGGHAALLIPRLAPGGVYIGLDVDPENLAFAQEKLEPLAKDAEVKLQLHQANFASAPQVLEKLGLAGVDRVLADLGFASNQMDNAERGMSFSKEGPLDMRLDPTLPNTAADLVNALPEAQLADLIFQYGEERLSRKIARKIVDARANRPMTTTTELAQVVREAYGPAARNSRIDPATRTFQALRIAVNAELEVLDMLLANLPAMLNPGGRVGIISFHSLEDRKVKQAFAGWRQDGIGKPITKKPVTAEAQELQLNPRSRSAKLRVFEMAQASDV